MIGSLQGQVEHISGAQITLLVQGVGYEVHCSSNALRQAAAGKTLKLIIYTDVKQDSIRLYGFEDRLEKQVFSLLMLVKGVGAKSAAQIVSAADKRDLLRLIAGGDLHGLQGLKGVGKKTAERIILELRDKVAEFALDSHIPGAQSAGGAFADAIEALQVLGFSRKDAELAVKKVEQEIQVPADSGSVVKEALKFI